MKNKWLIIPEDYTGLTAKAVGLISAELSAYTGYAVPVVPTARVTSDELSENNIILLGTSRHPQIAKLIAERRLGVPDRAQGYSAVLTDSAYSTAHQMLVLCGFDAAGVLYAAVDFVCLYVGREMHSRTDRGLMDRTYHDLHFRSRMPEWSHSSSPALEKRGIWTWGHCIYDYRRFLDNMLALKLNQLVIWNDFVPINGRAVVDYAHECGIEVYWGFSWGWDNRAVDFSVTDESVISEWSDKIFAQYASDYAPTGADGIYFQSFTETSKETVDGVLIADIVVKWVNTIGGRLLEAFPGLEIQFGLHATSVRGHLDSIARTDPRIRIVWEDCGAFPYAYSPKQTGNFADTLALNDRLCVLRGSGEKFGAVLKGMTTLDWMHFEHQTASFVLGESTPEFLADRTRAKERIWRIIQRDWMANLTYAVELVSAIRRLTDGATTVQWLVEDGCFDERVFYSAALAAEALWDCGSDAREILLRMETHPRVKFAN